MPDDGIEARAERLAQARTHWHCATHVDCWVRFIPGYQEHLKYRVTRREGRHNRQQGGCTLDHRTPAEQRAAALDAAATLWAYCKIHDILWQCARDVEAAYAEIQRTEGPQ